MINSITTKTNSTFNKIFLTVFGFFFSLISFAQEGDGGLDVDVSIGDDKGGSAVWYQNPLYWIIGGLLLIILVAIVARGGGSKK